MWGDDHEARDGPALYYNVQDEDDQLPVLSSGVPVGVPAVPAEGALRGVCEDTRDVLDGGKERGGAQGGGAEGASGEHGKGMIFFILEIYHMIWLFP